MSKGSDELHGFLGKGVEFEGQLRFEGAVQIEGSFKGEIEATGTLIVDEGARVEAKIRCGTLLLRGEVIGNIQTTNCLEAIAPARIIGDIQTPVLVINDGVYFEGNSQMEVYREKQGEQQKKIIHF